MSVNYRLIKNNMKGKSSGYYYAKALSLGEIRTREISKNQIIRKQLPCCNCISCKPNENRIGKRLDSSTQMALAVFKLVMDTYTVFRQPNSHLQIYSMPIHRPDPHT